ncbi:MAG: hypothetical protein HYT77_01695 [Deltaproteobacteria bacterium]|nr:hypothetical protein [Deltaproteobacteria bacterium]
MSNQSRNHRKTKRAIFLIGLFLLALSTPHLVEAKSKWKKGLLIGTLTGAVVGTGGGLLFANIVCEQPSPCEYAGWALGGLAGGAAVGAGLGLFIGLLIEEDPKTAHLDEIPTLELRPGMTLAQRWQYQGRTP